MISRFGDSTDPAHEVLVVKALLYKTMFRKKQQKPGKKDLIHRKEGIAAYDDIVARFGDSTDPAVCSHVIDAMEQKAGALVDKSEESIAVYDDIVARFGDFDQLDISLQVITAMERKAWALRDKPNERIATYDDIVDRFGDSAEPNLQTRVATVLQNKAWVLGEMGRYAEEIAVCDHLIGRFGGPTFPHVAGSVRVAENCKCFALRCIDEAGWSWPKKCYRRVLAWLGWRTGETAARPDVNSRAGSSTLSKSPVAEAASMVDNAEGVYQRGNQKLAIALYERAIDRFGDSSEPAVRAQVFRAMIYKARGLGTNRQTRGGCSPVQRRL